ncbi:MAG: hypothetical protein LUE96_11940 [Lachnospiraceae bacterium]|nr:hypothetical protein [Lachnospiraceae bacterium]
MSSISDYSYLFSNTGTDDYSVYSSNYWGNFARNRATTGSSTGTSVSSSSEAAADRSSNALEQILNEKKYPTASAKAQEANDNLTSGISSLNSALSTLQGSVADTTDGQDMTDDIVSAVKDYVSNYNDVITAAKGSTLTDKTAYVSNIMTKTAANADKLSEIGITVNSDGTVDVDEDALLAADVSKVKDLFSSDSIIRYGSTVASRLKFAGATESAEDTSASDGISITATASANTASTAAANLKADAKLLASDGLYEKLKDDDGNETDEYDVDGIFDAASSFVSNYNKMFDAAESSSNSGVLSNLSYIRNRTAANEETLAGFGITVDSSGKLAIDEDTFKASDMSKVQAFFKNYGSSVATNASLVNYYMTTQAGASSGYTSSGTYNVQNSAAYDTVA